MSEVVTGVIRAMDWKKLLGSVTNALDQELRLRNAYLLAENRLLRQQGRGRLLLTDSDRKELAAIGQQLGRKALAEIVTVAKADTIIAPGIASALLHRWTRSPYRQGELHGGARAGSASGPYLSPVRFYAGLDDFAPGLELVRSPAKAQSGSPLHDQRFAEIDFTFDGAELPASQPGHLSEGAPPGAAPPAALPVQTVRPRALPGCSRAAAACGAARRPGGGGAGGAA